MMFMIGSFLLLCDRRSNDQAFNEKLCLEVPDFQAKIPQTGKNIFRSILNALRNSKVIQRSSGNLLESAKFLPPPSRRASGVGQACRRLDKLRDWWMVPEAPDMAVRRRKKKPAGEPAGH
ncbi:hypothetical protein EN845_11685 [Mesorhizobium sp. M8A.F.Ca.ET.202.01.1.1]|nr:hypothetical protein EN845_11685 [Mesorhizobium sp. M8A.F.Ca.ET.202.01.1.1]TGR47301.1 hypothetical protein EN842_23405 [bacterium M00.F.Ca.ET.199.01.1.1]TGR55325.1 hypothetical protein EN841_08520 [Mesorhizobium sp. M8A.F.Ca.ET.198.01.1.1]TGU36755.1 hypothetical protein EN799_14190 [bacterium M00.F.Ca.ET.156.01.1.1]TGV87942.1 hypothetical protein EN792_010435 [Mesorhizobium sp. M00.F.Ca.ET.149.01.1.1]